MEIKLRSEHFIAQLFGMSITIIIIVLGISFICILNEASILTGTILTFSGFFIFSRAIKFVSFKENEIEVSYYFKKPKKIKYSQISKVYKNMEGLLGYVYVINYSSNKDINKVTFYCEENKFPTIILHLESKGVLKEILIQENKDLR